MGVQGPSRAADGQCTAYLAAQSRGKTGGVCQGTNHLFLCWIFAPGTGAGTQRTRIILIERVHVVLWKRISYWFHVVLYEQIECKQLISVLFCALRSIRCVSMIVYSLHGVISTSCLSVRIGSCVC